MTVIGRDCGQDIHGFVPGFAKFLFYFIVYDGLSDGKYNNHVCILGRSL